MMLEVFHDHIQKNFPGLIGKKLLVGCSGGVDSMVLCELLRLAGFEFAIAHANFTLRQTDSDLDQDFVRNYAGVHTIEFHTSRFDTNAFAADYKLSVQMAARRLRYEWFDQLVLQHNYDHILTAHHLDDSLETFLINFSRGTGISGLLGIPATNGLIVRPMLIFSRVEIENFARGINLLWREDKSNSSTKYLRNKIRHEIIPNLKSLNESFDDSLRQTLVNLQQAAAMQDDAAKIVYAQVTVEKGDYVLFKIADLLRLENWKAYLYYWLSDFGFSAWDDLYVLVSAQSGKFVAGRGYRLVKDREVLILSPEIADNQESHEVSESGQTSAPLKFSIQPVSKLGAADDNRIFADAGKLQFPLQLRRVREGDYFYPFGMTGKKKVSKFFKDSKTSLPDKQNAWILESAGQIVWIVGLRQDNRFGVTDKTKKIVQISIS